MGNLLSASSSSSDEEDILLMDPESLVPVRGSGSGSLQRQRRTLCSCVLYIVSSVAVVAKVVLRVAFVLLNNMYCIPTYGVWMVLLAPLKWYNPELYWRIEGTFFHWLLAMVSMWSWSAGYDVVEVGDDIRRCVDERTLIIANHQSTADVPMLMATFNPRPTVLPNIMWIMDRVFKFTNFGFVSMLHEDFFILSGRHNRDVAVVKLKEHIRDSYIPLNRKLMVLFPEGGFLRKRREISQRYALKNNLPVLNHVSLPRMGAMQGIIDVCGCKPDKVSPNNNTEVSRGEGGELSWVLDLTVAYPEGKPLDLPTLITGWRKPCLTYVFYRLYPASQIPTSEEQLTQWVFARWQEKEQILSRFYQTGEVPVAEFCSDPIAPQTVLQDPMRFFLLHLFFITSSYIHYRVFSLLYATLW